MSSSNKTYNTGNFNIRVSYYGISEEEQAKHKEHIDAFLDTDDGINKENETIDFRIIKDANAINMIKNEILTSGNYQTVDGYFKTPFFNYENDEAVYNYCENDNICVVKNKKDGSVSYFYEDNSRVKSDTAMCFIRELIIKKNKDIGNYILHSASFEKDGKGFVMVGRAGAGKTSLLIGYLKSGNGVKYISNDINFVDKTGSVMYPFQIPMLLSSDTAESYFGDKVKDFDPSQTISYQHKNLGKWVTKYKFSNKAVEELFGVKSSNSSNIKAIIIPNFSKENSGINYEKLGEKEAYEIILDQVLENDDRFEVDYLKLVENEKAYDKESFAKKLASEYEVVRVDYGVDIYKEENISKLSEMLDELGKEQEVVLEDKKTEEKPAVNTKNSDTTNLQKAGKKKFELHCHTTASDGLKSPTELVDFAEKENVDTIAITDHNTVDGSLMAQKYIAETGKKINIINGVEIDANDFSMFHLLAYGVKDMPKMKAYLDNLEEQNQEVFRKIIKNLTQVGVDISEEKVREMFGREKLSKIQIIKYLRNNGYAKDRFEVQDKYLGRHCPSYVERVQPPVSEVINFIHECGGICVFAHPMELSKMNPETLPDMETIKKLIIELKKIGLDGVECYSPKHTMEEAKELYEFCESNGLIQTYGNDYHAKEGQLFGADKTQFKNKLLNAINKESSQLGS
ncbi:MAG: PHP domain-containing protein [Clostridia bacterium]|nr:PHP domain-containing protein [Clostridia bacterium]